jgi:hypothetical protein
MSIYGTILSLSEDEHEDGCDIYVEIRPGFFEFSGKPCSCGTPRAPLVYEGSHVLPSDGDPRGGGVTLALISAHVEREDRPELPEGTLKDWLRLDVRNEPSAETYKDKPYVAGGSSTVVLTRQLVTDLRDALTGWLDRSADV